jgi:hypothetical protein
MHTIHIVITRSRVDLGFGAAGNASRNQTARRQPCLHATLRGRERMQLRVLCTRYVEGLGRAVCAVLRRRRCSPKLSLLTLADGTPRFAQSARAARLCGNCGGGGWRQGRAPCELPRPIELSISAAQDGERSSDGDASVASRSCWIWFARWERSCTLVQSLSRPGYVHDDRFHQHRLTHA